MGDIRTIGAFLSTANLALVCQTFSAALLKKAFMAWWCKISHSVRAVLFLLPLLSSMTHSTARILALFEVEVVCGTNGMFAVVSDLVLRPGTSVSSSIGACALPAVVRLEST